MIFSRSLLAYQDTLRASLAARGHGDELGEEALVAELDRLWYQLNRAEKEGAKRYAQLLAQLCLDADGNVMRDPEMEMLKPHISHGGAGRMQFEFVDPTLHVQAVISSIAAIGAAPRIPTRSFDLGVAYA